MCANCSMVCPTCFCSSVTQRSDLDGHVSTSERVWDFCFTSSFARVAGGNFRNRPRDRYRQWLTHKFSTWWDQFGSAGCVGCGRCIAWCPVGIDVRAELARIAPPPEPAVAAALVAATDPTAPTAAASRTPIVPGRASLPVLPPDAGTAQELSEYRPATVVGRHPETHDTVTIQLRTEDERILAGRPGQFVMIARPAFPIPPISVSRYRPDGLELTIRAAGPATRALAGLARGDGVALRGPLGRAWPVELAAGKDVVVIAGGIGLAPLRPVLDTVLGDRERYRNVRLLYGARTPADRLFVDEIAALEARDDIEVGTIVDRAGPDWTGRVGVVTALFDHLAWDGPNTVAFVCGPERMMEAVASALAARGVAPDRTILSLERNMACGVGLCGHCQLGPFFVCRDGPVFSLAELGPWFGREGV
jgi:NAD(P)H-flavin reductase